LEAEKMLQQLDQNLWVIDQSLRLMGFEAGLRCSVIRLGDGGLLLHSPVALSDDLRESIAALGSVRWIAAPNKFHHMFVEENAAAFPDARVYLAPGLREKQKNLHCDEVLESEAPTAWGTDIELYPLASSELVNEIAFLHRPSRTLLLTDLLFNLPEPESAVERLLLRINGCCGKLTTSRLGRFVVFRDRAVLRRDVDRILRWDFDRIIVSHGEVVERGGRDAFRESFEWLTV
jgi:hypothetical protein